MIADEQTQTLPDDPDKLASARPLLRLCRHRRFRRALTARAGDACRRHYVRLFETAPELTRGSGNMVFAGEADDPATVEALERLGFRAPPRCIAAVRGWHHGRYPAVRSARARELLTEVQPALLEALAETANPDLAFIGFDRFLSELPSGVQLFSLLKQNPGLLELIAAIMGTAPRLARILSKRRARARRRARPRLLRQAADAGRARGADRRRAARSARDFQEALDRARLLASEQQFLIGVRVL